MARTKNQGMRRGQVAEAAERAVARHGAEAVRVTDVAAEAGLSPATVMYYFPTRAALIRVAFERALGRFVRDRAAVIEAIADPREQLLAMLAMGFPTGHDDTEVVNLYTGVQTIRDDQGLASLVRDVTERQVDLYRQILERGAADESFRLAGDPDVLARNLVALEDAYGLYAVGVGTPVEEGMRLTRAFAELAVGSALTDPAER